MASEVSKLRVRGNMPMKMRVFEVTDFKCEVRIDL